MSIPGARTFRWLRRQLFGAPAPRTATGRITFAVSAVSSATTPLHEVPAFEAITLFLRKRVEACSSYRGRLVAGMRSHPLIGTLHAAFQDHRPVCLSPDIVWLTLSQGFAHHVNANAGALRPQLVSHEGKLTLKVKRNDFVKGSPENPWPEVFAEFSKQIRKHIGDDAHELLVSDFSTTGPVERAASEIVLMDAMQEFFDFELQTLCGIPEVTLEGTVRDWQRIAARAARFADFGLGWWTDALRPILAQFVAAAEGKPDPQFWESVYKWRGPRGSGQSPHVSGWVLNLFPYLNTLTSERSSLFELRRNPHIGAPESNHGPGPEAFPRMPARVPFTWSYLGSTFAMELIGGLVGVRQEPGTLCLRPEIGWAVRSVNTATS